MRRAASSIVTVLFLGACGTFGASSSDNGGGGTPPPQTPDQNAQPPIPGAPLVGIFASSSKGGVAPDATGAMDKPFKTLKDAIAVAQSSGQRVIACAEEFDEAVTVVDGVSMFGYYDCTQSPWARVDKRALVKSPTSPAVTVSGAPHKMRFDGFEIVAPDFDSSPATKPAASSIAVSVANAADLTFGDVVLRAGKAGAGADGVEPDANVELSASHNGGAAGLEGSATCNKTPPLYCERVPGSAGGSSMCKVGLPGGAGGTGGDGGYIYAGDNCQVSSTFLSFHPHGYLDTANATTALGGSARTVDSGGLLGVGGNGTVGADGTDGKNGAWSFSTGQFVPGDGTAGTGGSPGQGGGGAGGNTYFNDICSTSTAYPVTTGTGGGGGAGGCGGVAGTAGGGGGASIAALVVTSGAHFEASQLIASSGGAAGKGTLGMPGLAGGTGGPTTNLHTGGQGGNGGTGGSPGLAGNGAPGPSFALAWSGTRPDTDAQTQITAGSGGVAAPPLMTTTPSGATKSLPSVQGVAQAEYTF